MPDTPGAQDAANTIIGQLENAHLYLVGKIAATLAAGNGTELETWRARKAAQLAAMLNQARSRTLSTPPGTRTLIGNVVNEGAQVGAAWADVQADKAGARTAGLFVPPPILQMLTDEAAGNLAKVRLGLVRSIPGVYQSTLGETVRLMATGSTTLPEAVAESVDKMARRGLPGMVDRAGRGWRPETYAEMVLRTVYANASRDARISRLEERGESLVIVSDSPEECELCRPWEGKILSTSGPNVQAAATLGEARSVGLFHPRCTHSVNLWREGLTVPTPPRQNPEGYAESQRQRALERKVRESKRRLAAAEAAGAPNVGQARTRLKDDYRSLRTFLDDTGRLRRASGTWIPAP